MRVAWKKELTGNIEIDESELPANWDDMDWNDQYNWVAAYCEDLVDRPTFDEDDCDVIDFEVSW